MAWLRLVHEDDGAGVRAGLLQTTPEGAPLDFLFTRAGSGADAQGSDPEILPHLAQSLLSCLDPFPALVFAFAEEAPRGTLDEYVPDGALLCRVAMRKALAKADKDRAEIGISAPPGADMDVGWEYGRPGERGPTAFLNQVLQGAGPREPLLRAGRGLVEAFADRHVRALAAAPGLAVVVRLLALPATDGAGSFLGAGFAGERPPGTREGSPLRPPPEGVTLAERLWNVLAAPPRIFRGPEEDAPEWPGRLMTFQKHGVRALMVNERLLLADDMGLGKTVQAIAALRILVARREIASCLVAAPASLLDQWRRELAKWAPELSAIIVRGPVAERRWQWNANVDVTLISYDTLRADFAAGPQTPLRQRVWDLVVADEAQRIKNRNDTSAALKGLRRLRSWALSGTPIENHEDELASILEFVDHGDDGGTVRRYYPGAGLQERHRELQVRRKKSEVLADLPPKQTTKVAIDLNPRQRESYDKAEQEGIVYLRSLGAEVGVEHVLQLIGRLKQICNADPRTGESSKLADIRERLLQLSAQGHKALVFSQYTSDVFGVAAAAQYLREFEPLSFTGGMSPREREAVIQRFKENSRHRALVLSLRAGGLGLNLQEASYVFHLDRWWNPAVERQAEDRSHRMGQSVKVNVIKYSCTETIEQRIDEILERKQMLFDDLVDDVSLDLSAQMTREELFGLFGLEAALASSRPR